MHFDHYQEKAFDTLIVDTETHLTYGLGAEVGEVMSLMQKTARMDPRYWDDGYTPLLKERLFDELGDVLWYLTCLATHHGFFLGDIAQHNLEKLGVRKAEGKIQGDGDNR